MTDELRSFLEGSFQNSKAKEFIVGLADSKLGASISEGTKFSCKSNEFMLELLRGVRLHFDQFIKNLKVLKFSLSQYIMRGFVLRICTQFLIKLIF